MESRSSGWVTSTNGKVRFRVWVDYEEDIYEKTLCQYRINPKIECEVLTTMTGTVGIWYRQGADNVMTEPQYISFYIEAGQGTYYSKDLGTSTIIYARNADSNWYVSYTFAISNTSSFSSQSVAQFNATIWSNSCFPSCTYTVETNAPYCTQGSTNPGRHLYSVRVNTASINAGTSPYTGDTEQFFSIALHVGDKAASSTNAADLLTISFGASEISNVGESKSYTPTLTITNAGGRRTTYDLSQIEVVKHAPPTIGTTSCTPLNQVNNRYYINHSGFSLTSNNIQIKDVASYVDVDTTFGNEVGKHSRITVNNKTVTHTFSTITNTTGTYNITTTITDNLGASNTYTKQITVLPNTAPTCNCNPRNAPTGGYIAGWAGTGQDDRQYYVDINNVAVTANSYKSITSIILYFDSATSSSITTSGRLSVTPPRATGTNESITPRVIITDNLGLSTTYNLASVTVNPNNNPPAPGYNITSSGPYYAPNANLSTNPDLRNPYTIQLTNINTVNNKKITSIKVNFGGVNTTVTNPSNNTSITLYPELTGNQTLTFEVTDAANKTAAYNGPTVTINPRTVSVSDIKLTRINSIDDNTTAEKSDTGTQAVITATFNYTKYTNNNLIAPTVKVGNSSATVAWYTTWSGNTLSTSVNWNNLDSGVTLYGKIRKVGDNVAPFHPDHTYNISITPSTNATPEVNTNTKIATLAQAFYLLVGKAGGHALGIGKKPNGEGVLDIGMNKTILNNYGGQTPAISYQGALACYDMIKFIDNSSDTYGNGIVIGGGGQTIIGGGESADVMKAQTSTSGTEIMYIGNDAGVNIFTNLQGDNGWNNKYEFVFKNNGEFGLPLSQSDALYTAINNLGWTSAVIS